MGKEIDFIVMCRTYWQNPSLYHRVLLVFYYQGSTKPCCYLVFMSSPCLFPLSCLLWLWAATGTAALLPRPGSSGSLSWGKQAESTLPWRELQVLSALALTPSSLPTAVLLRIDQYQGLQRRLGQMHLGSSRHWKQYPSSSLCRPGFMNCAQRWPQWSPRHLKGLLLAQQPRLELCCYQVNSVLNISTVAKKDFPLRSYFYQY